MHKLWPKPSTEHGPTLPVWSGNEAYWQLDSGDVVSRLASNVDTGLSSKEVQRRHTIYGTNAIPEKDRRTALDILVSQFTNAFIYILFFASLVSIYLGEMAEALTIIAVLLVSCLLGFYQEYKSENAIMRLKHYLSRSAVVIRDGRRQGVNASDLVPGDIVLLEMGNIVPADVRLLHTDEFITNESAITGESRDIEKHTVIIDKKDAQPYELANCALMGTTVMSGVAKGIVVAIGTHTYFGKTATLLSAKIPESDFQINIRRFSNFTLRIIIVMTLVVFASNAFLNHGLFDSLLFALAVAVGIAPEILPVITTITLSNGALKMAKNGVVVKKLAAIEDIGNMNVLCMDKTGTLTEPLMELEGAIDGEGKPKPYDSNIIVYGMLCNHAYKRGKRMAGNLFDIAIMDYAKRKGIGLGKYAKHIIIDDVEFDHERKRMSVVIERDGKYTMFTKGEPESVIKACSTIVLHGKEVPLAPIKNKVSEKAAWFAGQGYSMLAVASKAVAEKENYTVEDERNLVLHGFLLFKSMPHKTAAKSIAELKGQGISLMLLTGDDPAVTLKLCKDVGLEVVGGKVITGSEIDGMDNKELQQVVKMHNVFARVAPSQKVRIIKAVQENNNIVGFMGDGVNDAPALRLSDVGISVNTAQDVAREAADIVLTKKSLKVIADGVREGRITFSNITKYILNTISANYGNITTVVLASFFLPFLPLLPVQILLNNLLSDIPNIAVAADNVDDEFVKRPTRWNLNMIFRFMVFFGLISALFDIITIAIFLYIFGVGVVLFRTLWFLESLLSEIFVTFIVRTKQPFILSMPGKLLIMSSIFIAMVAVAVVAIPPIGQYFEFVPPDPYYILIVGGIVLAYCIVTEIFKHFFFSYYKTF